MKKALQLLLISMLCLPVSSEVHASGRFDTLINSARTARSQGAFLKAAQLLLKAYQMSPNPVLLNNIGKMYEEAGKYSKAYEAYKSVADDPNAPSTLRPMNISRMNGIEGKLSKGHLLLKSPKVIREVRIGEELVTSAVFAIERSMALGKHPVEFSENESTKAYLSWVSMVAGERLTVSLSRLKKMSTGKIKGFDLTGLTALRINGHKVYHSKSTSLLLVPGTYLVEMEFRDDSLYERTLTLKKGSVVTVDDFATQFIQIRKPNTFTADPQFWFKGGAVALGVGLTTAGGLLALNASERHNQILGDASLNMIDAKQEWDDAQARGDRGLGLMGVGLTALTSGILWFALDPKEKQERGAWEWFPSPLLAPAYSKSNASLKFYQVH